MVPTVMNWTIGKHRFQFLSSVNSKVLSSYEQ